MSSYTSFALGSTMGRNSSLFRATGEVT
uniref:Uncharacterized protein n=1 Tax=Lepeophtheirus salmonis TaxID=72036 RepID=A0A0K2UTY6_LEPSM